MRVKSGKYTSQNLNSEKTGQLLIPQKKLFCKENIITVLFMAQQCYDNVDSRYRSSQNDDIISLRKCAWI